MCRVEFSVGKKQISMLVLRYLCAQLPLDRYEFDQKGCAPSFFF
jgi:hypothetical protein